MRIGVPAVFSLFPTITPPNQGTLEDLQNVYPGLNIPNNDNLYTNNKPNQN